VIAVNKLLRGVHSCPRMCDPKVILIGGAPGAGKTTLGRNLAIRLCRTSLTIDDLMTAARVVTTPQSHPGLHMLKGNSGGDYFTNTEPKTLIADAQRQHEEAWPIVDKIIRTHAAAWGSPIVIDGWAMRPAWVAAMKLDNIVSFWLVVDHEVLEQREAANTDFLNTSTDPARMLRSFLARSFWYNDLIQAEASEHSLPIIQQDGSRSVESLCDEILSHAALRAS
jgi:2-phosphoglycerate kinase